MTLESKNTLGRIAASFMLEASNSEKPLSPLPGGIFPVTRICANGKAETAGLDAPLSAGPLVWVCPENADTRFIAGCIDAGIPISTVISDAYMERIITLFGCVLICPEEIYDNVERLSGNNGIICYSESDSDPSEMPEALARMGYTFDSGSAPSALFSWSVTGGAFCADILATAETSLLLRTPAGLPVLTGLTCRCTPEGAAYTFDSPARHECRVFVNQNCGSVRAELSEDSTRLIVSGLEDAFVRFYPSEGIPGSEAAEGWQSSYDEMSLPFIFKIHVNGTAVFRIK